MNTCDEVPCQESPHEFVGPPRDGISPAAVAGWAVEGIEAREREWRKAEADFKDNLGIMKVCLPRGVGGVLIRVKALKTFQSLAP